MDHHIAVSLLGYLAIMGASARALADAPPDASPPSPSPPAASKPAPLTTSPPPPAPPPGTTAGAPGLSPPQPWAGPWVGTTGAQAAPPPYPYAYPYPYYGYPRYQEPPRKVWYGWQTLIVLGVSTLWVPASASIPWQATIPLGLAGFTLGGPIVHWAHGHVGKGFAVLGMHIGVTAGGGLLGLGTMCSIGMCAGKDGVIGVMLGLLGGGGVGLLTSTIIDVAVLAKEERPAAQVGAKRAGRQVMVLPNLDVRKDRAVFGLMGSF